MVAMGHLKWRRRRPSCKSRSQASSHSNAILLSSFSPFQAQDLWNHHHHHYAPIFRETRSFTFITFYVSLCMYAVWKSFPVSSRKNWRKLRRRSSSLNCFLRITDSNTCTETKYVLSCLWAENAGHKFENGKKKFRNRKQKSVNMHFGYYSE